MSSKTKGESALGEPFTPLADGPPGDGAPDAPSRLKDTPWIPSIGGEHVSVTLTLGYLGLTLIGVLYNFYFFRAFGVNILGYAETSDFLLAAAREPLAIVLCVVPVSFVPLAIWLRRLARRKIPRYEAYAARYDGARGDPYRRFARLMAPLVILSYAAVFTKVYATLRAELVKRGRGERVHVDLMTEPAAGDGASVLMRLGSTSNYLFVYDRTRRETSVLPLGNVARITVEMPRRRGAAPIR